MNLLWQQCRRSLNNASSMKFAYFYVRTNAERDNESMSDVEHHLIHKLWKHLEENAFDSLSVYSHHNTNGAKINLTSHAWIDSSLWNLFRLFCLRHHLDRHHLDLRRRFLSFLNEHFVFLNEIIAAIDSPASSTYARSQVIQMMEQKDFFLHAIAFALV